jgi:hypothetical protein
LIREIFIFEGWQLANNDIVERRCISYCTFTKKIYCNTTIIVLTFIFINIIVIVLEVNIKMYNCNVSIALIGGWYISSISVY